jgi:hypothetical protein
VAGAYFYEFPQDQPVQAFPWQVEHEAKVYLHRESRLFSFGGTLSWPKTALGR